MGDQRKELQRMTNYLEGFTETVVFEWHLQEWTLCLKADGEGGQKPRLRELNVQKMGGRKA